MKDAPATPATTNTQVSALTLVKLERNDVALAKRQSATHARVAFIAVLVFAVTITGMVLALNRCLALATST